MSDATKYLTLREVINNTCVYDSEGDDWKLEDIGDEDLADDITDEIIRHLNNLRKNVPKPVFGDTTSITNSAYNAGIDQLIEDLREGTES